MSNVNSGASGSKKVIKKNGFFFFMKEKIRQLNLTGGYRYVAELVSDEWQELSSSERQRFSDIAQKYNNRVRPTSGNPPEPFKIAPWMKKNDQRMQEAKDHVLEIVRRNDSVEIPIVLISFGTYFETTNSKGTLALPSEVGLVAFSIEDGVYDNFSSLIDPGEIVNDRYFSYKVMPEVNRNAKLKHMPTPNYNEAYQNYKKILEGIEEFVDVHSRNYFKEAAYVFCLDSESDFVAACLNYLIQNAGFTPDFKVLSLNSLIESISRGAHFKLSSFETSCIEQQELSSAIAMKKEIVGNHVAYPSEFNLEIHVEDLLARRNYAYFGELSCLYHMELDDGVHHCSQNKVNRYAFGLLDALLEKFDVIPEPGRHYPRLNNMKQERTRRRDMLTKWTIGDPSYVVYQEFLKSVEGRLFLDKIKMQQKPDTGIKFRKAEMKRRNRMAINMQMDITGATVGRNFNDPNGFELV